MPKEKLKAYSLTYQELARRQTGAVIPPTFKPLVPKPLPGDAEARMAEYRTHRSLTESGHI